MTHLESRVLTDTLRKGWDKHESTSVAAMIKRKVRAGAPISIVGPCAMQSEQQITDIASIVHTHVDGVRANHKKPRTRIFNPDGTPHYLGIETERPGLAVNIYRKLKQKFPHLFIATEVMTGNDVRQLGNSVDLVWRGARSIEQEPGIDIGKAASEINMLVMQKNPQVDSLEQMVGMLEALSLGMKDQAVPLLACMRGIDAQTKNESHNWRNVPNFEWIPVLLKHFPELTILVDPSHMLRKEDLTVNNILNLILRGLNAGAHGFMVEVFHPTIPSLTDPGVDVGSLMEALDQENLLAKKQKAA